ncbi:hypothetical protein QTO34_001334 [Cnephaeus nilssonii]|uniref:E3 ubiquitin-protein ligase E3D n=1 Tax=Cnephaeus nilssonii TaxID=3371016 RepID=A0AA40LM69_CNENI|nr:hypothetical protein QTO34_001334 [Eptesicus nilssonii]
MAGNWRSFGSCDNQRLTNWKSVLAPPPSKRLVSSWESDISVHSLTLPSATCLELLLILSRNNATLPPSLRCMNSFQHKIGNFMTKRPHVWNGKSTSWYEHNELKQENMAKGHNEPPVLEIRYRASLSASEIPLVFVEREFLLTLVESIQVDNINDDGGIKLFEARLKWGDHVWRMSLFKHCRRQVTDCQLADVKLITLDNMDLQSHVQPQHS